ncbi:acetyltransferase [Pseudalkalibacillus berkeleyi]|uniref:Acetyltransferase n=1 Tax=Pseudalkalibacillus berkeleyi TaxID=1069813 RepID=A0ABS9H3Z3_9BACL|nr:acetyltransferase [Pseudalkalibacillus berkeleyi]MCF6138826.1 acetyltransferase [Pseudalkalibacillus berkeleyi]
MKDIVIIGAGGFGREVAWLIEEINRVNKEWNIVGFVDDNEKIQGTEVSGYKVVGDIEWLKEQKVNVACAIGDPITKKKTIESLNGSKISFPVLIHPSVIYSDRVGFGAGSIICAANILTTDIQIGNHVIINLDCTIGHDATLGNYTTILPSVNVSGNVVTKECVSVGTGSAIIQGVTIGENTVVGAGAVVVKELPANCTAVGAPANPIKFHE